jgi:hypothetical protein
LAAATLGCHVVFVEKSPAQYDLLKTRLDGLRNDQATASTFFGHCTTAFDLARKNNMMVHKLLPKLAKAKVIGHSTFTDPVIPLADLCGRAAKDIVDFLLDDQFSEAARAAAEEEAKQEAAMRAFIEDEAEAGGGSGKGEHESEGSDTDYEKESQTGVLLSQVLLSQNMHAFPFQLFNNAKNQPCKI